MSKKVKLTRPELKRRRDQLARFERYLPMLKLKQQQLQGSVLKAVQIYRKATAAVVEAEVKVDEYRAAATIANYLSTQSMSSISTFNNSRKLRVTNSSF